MVMAAPRQQSGVQRSLSIWIETWPVIGIGQVSETSNKATTRRR
jgi:hypothetical protein